jgi:hypothetical protein
MGFNAPDQGRRTWDEWGLNMGSQLVRKITKSRLAFIMKVIGKKGKRKNYLYIQLRRRGYRGRRTAFDHDLKRLADQGMVAVVNSYYEKYGFTKKVLNIGPHAARDNEDE